MLRALVLAGLVFFTFATDIAAQAVQRPTRPYRGLFGGGRQVNQNRTRQEFELTGSALVGYDDNVYTGGALAPGQSLESGLTGTGDLSTRYFYGRAGRSVSIDGHAFTTAYGSIDVSPSIGGNMTFQGETTAGRRTRLIASQGVGYAPNLVLGAFETLEPDVDPNLLPDSGDANSVVAQRSWSSDTALTIERQWTTRQNTSLSYTHSQRTYLDEVGYDSSGDSVNGSYGWTVSRAWTLQGSYGYTTSVYAGADPTTPGQSQGPGLPLTDHSVEGGATYARRLSPTRQVALSMSGGATYVETMVGENGAVTRSWVPSGTVNASIDFGRSWAMAGDYRRGVSVLQGVSLQTFTSDSTSVRLTGTFSPRVEGAFSFAYSNGRSSVGEEIGRYGSYGVGAQLRYALARCCAASVNYDYYSYALHEITDVPTGLPVDYERNAVRVGITFWLPLYGSYGGGERQGGR